MTDRPDTADQGPEPDGGPFERERQFLEERFATLGPKGEPNADALDAASLLPGEDPALPSGDAPLPADYRRDLVRQFRGRQRYRLEQRAAEEEAREEAKKKGKKPATTDDETAFDAPVPPPENNWIPIGPSVLRQGQGAVKPATSGRTPGIAVAPGGDTVYIASHNGGVWRSDDAGQSWRSLMDAFDLNPGHAASDSLACGAIALDPANIDRVFVGTGEGASSGSAFLGVGPVVTIDGGVNWITEPSNPDLGGSAFYALAVDPGNPDRVVAATRRGVYRREPAGGGGVGWTRKTMGGQAEQRVTSVVAARSGGTTTFFAVRQGGPVFSSADGHTWSQAGAGFPSGGGRVTLAVQEGNPNVVYALTSTEQVWRLDLADGTWRAISGVPANFLRSQGSYDLAMAVAPNNVNRIYLGGAWVLTGGDYSGAVYRCEVTVAGATVSMAPTYIGSSVHADVHTIVFAPGDATKLWVGCDGGVFSTTNPTGSGDIFVSRNIGLQTLSMNFLAQHPTEDAVLFSGTQDNGGVRFTGEEAWLYSSGGDGGFALVNWNDRYRVLSTYIRGGIRRSSDGGTRYSYSPVDVPLNSDENVLFYAPIAGTPMNMANPAEAEIVAFGSIRPWISTNFGTSWQSIPNGNLAADSLDERIRSLTFASATRLYAGTMSGSVYRFVRSGGVWTRTQIDTLGGANSLPLGAPITSIAVDPADVSGNSMYITFAGIGDYRHIWHFNGTQWQQRSGPAAGNVNSLLDVQTNAVVADPANPTHLYAGADIGAWRSVDSGATWETYSEGLPDAAVLDLALHNGRRLLRAATHGRSVFERTLPELPKQGVELYVRDTQLDQGRFTTVNFLPDPTQQGQTVRHWRGPDIKLDTPNAMGQYQFPPGSDINFFQFDDTLSDDFQNVATHATAAITTRVYVQVHNRGVIPASNVQVMLLLANASAGLPPLPAGYTADVQSGTPIANANWQTVGIVTVHDVRAGFPKIAAFDLTSDKLPPPANLAGNDHHCVLALLHHADDPFTTTETVTDNVSLGERKAAHKNLKVVQFTGTLPEAAPIVIPIRLHNPYLDETLLTDVLVDIRNYRGRVRLYIPPLELDGEIKELIEGLYLEEDFGDFRQWAEEQRKLIAENQQSKHPYNREWSKQRLGDAEQAMQTGYMLSGGGKSRLGMHRIVMRPDSYHTIFLMLDRPVDGREGEAFDIEVMQTDVRRESILGGQDLRIELVPDPEGLLVGAGAGVEQEMPVG